MWHPSSGAAESIDGGGDDEGDEAEEDEAGGEVVVGRGAGLGHLARRGVHHRVTGLVRGSLDHPQGHFSRAPSFPEFPAGCVSLRACLPARKPQIRLPAPMYKSEIWTSVFRDPGSVG